MNLTACQIYKEKSCIKVLIKISTMEKFIEMENIFEVEKLLLKESITNINKILEV